VDGLNVIPVQNLREAAQFLEGEIKIAPTKVDLQNCSSISPMTSTIFPRSKDRKM